MTVLRFKETFALHLIILSSPYTSAVNWRLLQEEVFLDRRFHIALLALHLSAVVAFMAFRWARCVCVCPSWQYRREYVQPLLFLLRAPGRVEWTSF